MDNYTDQENIKENDLQKPEPSLMLWTLTVCTAILLVWAAFVKLKRHKRLKPDDLGYITVSWTSFRLPILEGLMIYRKGRKYGLAVADQIAAMHATINVSVVKVGLKNIYFVRDLDIIQELLKSDNLGYLGKPKEFYDFAFPGPLGDGLISSALSVWRPHRKAVAPAFSYRSLKAYFQYTNDCVQKCFKKSLKMGSGGNAISNAEMRELLDYYGMKLTTQILLGKEVSSATKDGRQNLGKTFRIGKHITMDRFMNPFLLLPLVWRFHPKRLQQEAALASGSEFADKAIKLYRKSQVGNQMSDNNEDNGKSTNVARTVNNGVDANPSVRENKIDAEPSECILQHLIKSDLSDKEIIDEVMTFLAAGYETVRTALDLLIFQLALNPGCQRKCQQEVDTVITTSLEDDTDISSLTWDDLSNLKYLEQCILESLRITPTVPLFARKLEVPMKLTSALTAKRGEIIVIIPWSIHRNPAYYENPKVFDPERFTAENIKKRHAFSYLPFSSGKRNCIGYKLALVQMRVFMAWLIRHYEFTTTDKLDDIRLDFAVTVEPERPYNILYKKRI